MTSLPSMQHPSARGPLAVAQALRRRWGSLTIVSALSGGVLLVLIARSGALRPDEGPMSASTGEAIPEYAATVTFTADSAQPVTAPNRGRVVRVLAAVGDQVRAGDTLVLLENADLDRSLAESEAQLTRAEQDTLRAAREGVSSFADEMQSLLSAYTGALPFQVGRLERSQSSTKVDQLPSAKRAMQLADSVVLMREAALRLHEALALAALENARAVVRSHLSQATLLRRQHEALAVRAPAAGAWAPSDSIVRRGYVVEGDRLGSLVRPAVPSAEVVLGALVDEDRLAIAGATIVLPGGVQLLGVRWRADPLALDGRERWIVTLRGVLPRGLPARRPLEAALLLPSRRVAWIQRGPQSAAFAVTDVLEASGAVRRVRTGPYLRLAQQPNEATAVELRVPPDSRQ